MKCRAPSSTRTRLASATIAAFFLLSAAAGAQPDAVPRTEPRREAYAFAAAEDAMPWETALQLALWASAESDVPKAYGAIAGEIGALAAATASMDARAKGEAVLEFMHRRFLRGYSERQTRVDTLVSTGQFNCVSSAALYVVLGTAVGLDVTGVMTKDHAFCSVRVGVDSIDVETTNVYGFDPGTKKEFHDSFGRATGFAYVPSRNYRDRTPISRKELFSLILSNRASDLESNRRFAEAVGVAVDRWALLGGGNGAARDELLSRLLNYGAFLANAGNENAALDWAVKSVSLFGDDRRWADFIYSAANNLVVKSIRSGRSAQARADAERFRTILPAASFRELDRLTTDAELVESAEASVRDGDAAAFEAKISAARAAAAVAPERIREIEVYAALKQAERIARTGGWAAALAEIDRYIGKIGNDRKLEDARRAYRSNRIADLHNAFAAAYNSKRYAEAREAARKALAEFPEESRFRSALDAAERALNR